MFWIGFYIDKKKKIVITVKWLVRKKKEEVVPSIQVGSSLENTQGGLSSGGAPPSHWIFSVWDQMMSLVVPL